MIYKQIVIPTTITDMIDARNQAVSRLETAYTSLDKAKEELDAIGRHLLPYNIKPRLSLSGAVEELDRRMWRHSFDKAGLFKVMDEQAKNEFERELKCTPPEFSLNNIQATFVSLASDSDRIFKRGLVNLFRSLSSKLKTNDAFKIGKKIIKGYMVSSTWGRLEISNTGTAPINDLDRVFKVLDGKNHQPRALEGAINTAWAAGDETYEDEYFKIRGFKNGNAHITFKRPDLIDKANEIIHEYYQGNSLAEGV